MPGTKFKPFSLYGEPERPATPFKPFSLFDEGAAQAAPKTVFRPFSLDDPSAGASALNNQPVVNAVKNLGIGTLSAVGYMLQPFQAFQQGLYGAASGLQALGKLAVGDTDEANRIALQGQGAFEAAGGYLLGWGKGLGGNVGKRIEEMQGRAQTGWNLMKNVGAPDWLAKWGGLGADFLADPALLLSGGANAFLKVGTATSKGARAAGALADVARLEGGAPSRLFLEGTEMAGLATKVNAPIRTAFRAIPESTRENMARFAYGENPIGAGLGTEFTVPFTGGRRTTPLEFLVPAMVARRVIPQGESQLQDAIRKSNFVADGVRQEYAARFEDVYGSWERASAGLKPGDVRELDRITSRLADGGSGEAWDKAWAELEDLAARTNRPDLIDVASEATAKGVAFDFWSGHNLIKVKQFTEDGLKGTLGVDEAKLAVLTDPAKRGTTPAILADSLRGSVRRMYAVFGEHPEAHLTRILAQNKPASVVLDDVKLRETVAGVIKPRVITPAASAAPSGAASSGPLPFIDLDQHSGALLAGEKVRWRTVDGRLKWGRVADDGTIERIPYTGPKPGLDNLTRADEGQGVARGQKALIERVQFEVRKGDLDPQVGEAAVQFARLLPSEYLSGLGSTFRNTKAVAVDGAAGLGFYDPETAIIGIAKLGVNESAVGERTIIHEVAHHLEAFVPQADREGLRALYERERRIRADRVTGNDAYRYQNFQEWFAENITDRGLRDVYPEGPTRGLWERVKRVVRDAAVSVYNFYLRGGKRDLAESVYRNLIGGRYDAGQRSDLGTGALAMADAASVKNVDPAEITQTLKSIFRADPEMTLAEAVAKTVRSHGLTQEESAGLIAALVGADSGLTRIPSSRQTFDYLRKRLEEGGGAFGGGGQLNIKAGKLGPREDLADWQLANLGEVQSFRAQYAEQAQVVGESVARRTALLELRKFLDENGLVNPFGTTPDLAKNPLNAPGRGVRGFKRPGVRTLNADDVKGLDGIFQAGEEVPDSVWRVLRIGANKDPIASNSVFTKAVNDWKAAKLGNLSTAVINALSNVISGDQHDFGPLAMARGLKRFATRTPEQEAELMSAQLYRGTQVEREIRLDARRARIIAEGNADKSDPLGYLTRVSDALFNFTGEMTGSRPGSLDGIAGAVARNATRPFAAGTGAVAGFAVAGPPGAAVGAVVGGAFTGPKLLALHGATENAMKSAIYLEARAQGASIDKATELAHNILFDYNARPLAVALAARTGFMPFATFTSFASWRILENLYDRPYRTARYYRVPDSLNRDNPNAEADLEAMKQGQMAYLREKGPIPLFTDGNGRTFYAPGFTLMPESAAADVIGDANSSNFLGVFPNAPGIQLVQAWASGIGFRGNNPFAGLVDKGGYFEAAKVDKPEAIRRSVELAWQFMGYPWMPGQAVTDRLAKSIAAEARSEDDLAKEGGFTSGAAFREAVLKFWSEGPAALVNSFENQLPVTSANRYGEPAYPTDLAVARLAGLKAYPVQSDVSQPGTANRAVTSAQYALQDRENYLTRTVQSAALNGVQGAQLEVLKKTAALDLLRYAQRLSLPVEPAQLEAAERELEEARRALTAP